MAEVGQSRHAAVFARGGRATRVMGAAIVAALASVVAVQMVPAEALVVVVTPAAHSRAVSAGSVSVVAPAPKLPEPRVLFMGDSLMDQQGSAAAFELRQNGINAKSLGAWGTSLLTRNQYDFGKTKLTGGWLLLAAQQIKSFDPNVVAVYLNHNYWPPYPRDAAGNEIVSDAGLWSAAGQSMLRQQATALVTILRSRGAAVYFVSPVPAGLISNPDPNVWSPIWHGYQSVLKSMHVPVIDSAAALRGPNGLRKETAPSCTGAPEWIRPAADLHMTRFGAGLAGSALATAITDIVGGSLNGNSAPGERTAALVPVPTGGGYWLVGCDGSVYHFGHAANLPGARAAVAGRGGVTAAAATPDGKGLWLVTADGTILPIGDATAMTFGARPTRSVTGASATPDGTGIVATTSTGVVLTAGTARSYGDLEPLHVSGIVDIEATRSGKGYWLARNDGRVFAFGDARSYGSAQGLDVDTSGGSIVGIAATPDDRGYWEVSADGSVFAFGDATFLGTGHWVTPPYPYSVMRAVPGPSIDIVAAPGAKQGYWIIGDTGRVSNLGAAVGSDGDAGLAIETQ
jgi:hypothetical protein